MNLFSLCLAVATVRNLWRSSCMLQCVTRTHMGNMCWHNDLTLPSIQSWRMPTHNFHYFSYLLIYTSYLNMSTFSFFYFYHRDQSLSLRDQALMGTYTLQDIQTHSHTLWGQFLLTNHIIVWGNPHQHRKSSQIGPMTNPGIEFRTFLLLHCTTVTQPPLNSSLIHKLA